MQNPVKTPLYDAHVALGGKIVEFGGFLLPVQYGTGVIKEHMAVRTAAGLFDVSHMGEFSLTGPDAVKNLNRILTNDFSVMYDGQARYSPMCNEEGGTVDDLIVYKVSDSDYFIVVNAANREKDFSWMESHMEGDVVFRNISDDYAQIALQGPKAEEIIKKLVKEEDIPAKYYSAKWNVKIGDSSCILSRTGYTGEAGFEIYLPSGEGCAMWYLLLETGKEEGLIPCGLGARDTLRLEASMPLYGHELSDVISPLAAGLKTFVKMDKEDFIGKSAMLAAGTPKRRRVGLRVTGKGIIREHQDLYIGENKIGVSTSGTHCPYLGYPVAMAYVDAELAEPGTVVEADVRGRRVAAEIVKMPFYKRA